MEGAAKVLIDKQIQTNKVMIFSKTHCPHCNTTKKLFKGEPYVIVVC